MTIESRNLTPIITGRNFFLNPLFNINERLVTGTVILPAGDYGHDQVRGGSGGGEYTFAKSGGVTTLTIAAANTIEQDIDGSDVPLKNVVLSWEGTAQGRINGGSFGDSGQVTALGVFGGNNVTVEFDDGTLTKVQLEEGVIATSLEYRTDSQELFLCQKYLFVLRGKMGIFGRFANGFSESGGGMFDCLIKLPSHARNTNSTRILSDKDHFIVDQASNSALPDSMVFSDEIKGNITLAFNKTGSFTAGEGGIIGFDPSVGISAFMLFSWEF